MKRYIIISPVVVFSTRQDGERKEYLARRNDVLELPEDDLSVRTLIVRGLIREVAEISETKVKVKSVK